MTRSFALAAALALILSGCGQQAQTDTPDEEKNMAEIEHLSSEQFERMGLPFSEAVRVGDLLFLSGQIGTDENDQLVAGGLAAEAEQMMENIKSVVERYGGSMERVVKCTVFLADIAEWPAFNEVYVRYFPGKKPARSAFAASGLALNARVEMECIAAL